MAKMRQFGWLESTDVIILTVGVIGLTVQAVSVLTQAVATNMATALLAMIFFGVLYHTMAGITNDMLHMRRHDRLLSRLQRQTGEAFSDCPPVSGTVPGFDEPFIAQYFMGEEHIALLTTCQGCWTMCVMVGHRTVVQIGNEAVRTIHEAWQVDREAAVVTARLLCQPAVVLWLESAEVVW